MNIPVMQRRTLTLLAVIIPLLVLFVYLGFRSGPLAPVAVTLVQVKQQAITPALFGIGTIEARYTHKIGPTYAGRLARIDVNVGDSVAAGQVLGEMASVDLNDRIHSLESAQKRAQAGLRGAAARQAFAQTQARRYEQLFEQRAVSEEALNTKRQEAQIANAVHAAAQQDLVRAGSDLQALFAQRSNLQLISPNTGVVAVRHADPGSTLVAGQPVIEIIDPNNLWINVRFDQVSSNGLTADLPAKIELRSRAGQVLQGSVLRIEMMADAVTEETLAKVVFTEQLSVLPPLGELAEVTVMLPALAPATVIPYAAVRVYAGKIGVWKVVDGKLSFNPVNLGRADLEGLVQVTHGLLDGEMVVLYSEKLLAPRSRINVVEQIPGVDP